jgi:hypothetical protein
VRFHFPGPELAEDLGLNSETAETSADKE